MSIELLKTSVAGFVTLLNSVEDSQWGSPTACEGWDVTALVDHIVGGAQMSALVLNGGTKAEAESLMSAVVADSIAQKRAAVESSAAQHIEAFDNLSSLAQVVHHPAMDMPAAQLLGFRIGDYLLHTWDLAHGLGRQVTLDEACVSFMWDVLSPMGPMLGKTGRFGEGPSGKVPESASLQDRLIDLSGRRA